ncbi:hypothetical protein ACLB2K_058394 [Fragaria x ananassa]
MAPKRLLQDPPAASSMEEDSDAETVDEEEEEVQNDVVEDEEDKSGDEEDDEDEEEDDEENVTANKKPNVPNPPSESASDAGSETESDAMTHSPTASDFTVKPIVSKPMNDSPAKPTKKTAAAAAPAKRAAESDPNPKDSKKKKKKKKGSSGSGEDEETKKAGRLWGEDDEIAILEGMIEFKAKNGTDPSSNMGAFHEFLRRSLKADVNKNQLMDKARRLKKKYYLPNANKGENGEGPLFSKAHELKLVDLSNKIWGVEANGGGGGGGKNSKKKPRKSAKAVAVDNSASPVLALPVSYVPAEKSAEKKVEKKAEMNNVANGGMEAESDEVFWSKYPFLRDSLRFGKWDGLEMVLMQGMPSIGSSKAKGLDDRWRKLQVLEMELVAKKLALEHEMTKFILDSMKSRKE